MGKGMEKHLPHGYALSFTRRVGVIPSQVSWLSASSADYSCGTAADFHSLPLRNGTIGKYTMSITQQKIQSTRESIFDA